jgi:hypothetical protein
VSFSEQVPSKQWAVLTFKGQRIADVWFKPEGEPLGLTFRIPRSSFETHGISQRLTMENLLKAVAVTTDQIESWCFGGATDSAADGSHADLSSPLSQPADDVPHLEIQVRLKPPHQAVADEASGEPEAAPAEWHDLEARWKAVLGLEAAVDTLRKNVESIRAELEAVVRRSLTADDKVHALAADVAQWNKAKSRAHFATPKANEFIHRATWAAGTPERKRLGELFKAIVENQTARPPASEVSHDIEFLRKDRQVLSSQGMTVYQECKAIAADVQAALRRLQSNAASRASQKKGGSGAKGKSY